MGTPAPIDNPGSTCSLCFGIGGAFGVPVTPKYLTVEVVGIEKGSLWVPADGMPTNGRWCLQQLDLYPCIFQDYTPGGYNLTWYVDATRTRSVVRSYTGVVCFENSVQAPCSLKSSNLLGGDHFVGGTMEIFL